MTSLKRSPLFPNLPTVDESGVPKFEEITFNGIVAPAGTPREVLARLNSEIAKAVKVPEQHKRYLERGDRADGERLAGGVHRLHQGRVREEGEAGEGGGNQDRIDKA